MLAIVLLLPALIAWEMKWRQLDHPLTVTDDPALWSIYRGQAVNEQCDAVVAIGASRLLLGFDMQTAREMLPSRNVLQLGVNGHFPLATLEDLAEDGFCGVALVSVLAQAFDPGGYWVMQQSWPDYYHRISPSDWIDRRLFLWLERRLRMTDPDRSVWAVLDRLYRTGRWPKTRYHRMLPDRSIQADYTRANVERLADKFVNDHRKGLTRNPPPDPETWFNNVQGIRPAVEAIQKRGGQVVFLRFPTERGHWEVDEEFLPKADYWDRLGEASGAETLHFKDVPELDQFELPDTSHLDYRDAPAFTRELLEALMEKGVLPPQPPP